MNVEVPTRALVFSLVSADGTLHADRLYDVAALLGMSDQQVRLCVKRLVVEGRFSHEGRGRKAVLRLIGEQSAAEAEFIRFAFRQDRGLEPWDGVWHLAGFAVPESSRAARDALRESILYLGGAPLQGGLYVSPNAWESLITHEADRLEVSAGLTIATTRDLQIGGETDPVRLAASLWPLEEIAARYTRLAEVARTRLVRLQAGVGEVEALKIMAELGAEFDRAMIPDPLLPPELLPRPWAGSEARAVVAQCWGLPQLRTLMSSLASGSEDAGFWPV